MGTLLVLWFAAAMAQGDSPLEHVDVFTSGTDDCDAFRVLAIEAVPNGPLLAFAEARKHSRHDPGWEGQDMNTMQRQWSAEELFQLGTSHQVMADSDGATLSDQVLIEDDAPACGYTVEADVTEILEAGVVLKKTLVVGRLPVLGASIVMLAYPSNPPAPNQGQKLVFNVNGRDDIVYELKHFWTRAPVPVEQLRQGENEILVRVLDPAVKFTTYV